MAGRCQNLQIYEIVKYCLEVSRKYMLESSYLRPTHYAPPHRTKDYLDRVGDGHTEACGASFSAIDGGFTSNNAVTFQTCLGTLEGRGW